MSGRGTDSRRFAVIDLSQAYEARRVIRVLADEAGFDEVDAGRAALVASEMATNLVKHAGGGSVLLRLDGEGLELLAVDSGPGMTDPSECLRDGFSTAGSSGTGLGAIRRLSDDFDLHTRPGAGTVVLARLRPGRQPAATPPPFRVGAVSLPAEGETVNGDGWVCHQRDGTARVAVFDGLGHGPEANRASAAAIALVVPEGDPPAATLQRVHHGIRHTRGAAGAMCELHAGGGQLRFSGIGNVLGTVVSDGATRSLVSHNGTLGQVATRFQDVTSGHLPGDLVVIASDGLSGRWDLARYPGLAARDPAVIAAVLWRDFHRQRDDATVVVLRER